MKNKKREDSICKKHKGLLFLILKGVVRPFYKKYKIIGLENIPSEPSVIVGNHAQMHGPLCAETTKAFKRYTWCIGDLMHLKSSGKYIFKDFWGYKPKSVQWIYKIFAFFLAPVLVYIFRNADTIAVYKDMRAISTFKKTIKGLKQDAHIILFPEFHKEYNNIINEFQDKFIDVARLYYKDTGKELSFVPMYIAPKLKTIVYGKAIKYDNTKSTDEQRKSICNYLKNEITKLAMDLPAHRVVPYANIAKSEYPISK